MLYIFYLYILSNVCDWGSSYFLRIELCGCILIFIKEFSYSVNLYLWGFFGCIWLFHNLFASVWYKKIHFHHWSKLWHSSVFIIVSITSQMKNPKQHTFLSYAIYSKLQDHLCYSLSFHNTNWMQPFFSYRVLSAFYSLKFQQRCSWHIVVLVHNPLSLQ